MVCRNINRPESNGMENQIRAMLILSGSNFPKEMYQDLDGEWIAKNEVIPLDLPGLFANH